MTSKIVIRTMLVAALVVTAHTIKPFSFGSITLHALGAARSLSFAMPEAAAERVEYAHYLAQTYGKGLFDDDADSVWAKRNLLGSEFVAVANSVELVELNEDAEIKDVKSADSSRKPAQKRPVRRIKRDEAHDEDSGCSKTSEIAELPEVRTLKAVALVPQTNALTYQPEMVTLVQHSRRLPNLPSLKVEWIMISKPTMVVSLCRDASVTKTEIVEAPVEIVIGPEEGENVVAEPEQLAPPASEATTPRIPECIRIP